MIPRVLIIAGSDSGGGAGIQADLKTVSALGAFGMTALTAVTAQNTTGVYGVIELAPDFVAQQIEVCVTDIGCDAVKTGMLSTAPIIESVVSQIKKHCLDKLVVDPVMVAKTGAPLLHPEAKDSLVRHLFPLATVITPNLAEAQQLTGMKCRSVDDMKAVARTLHQMGPQWIVVKGGHLQDFPFSVDIVTDGQDIWEFSAERVDTINTHGTGCIFASAIATFLAFGLDVPASVARAKEFVTAAIKGALAIGHGFGPANPMAEISQWRSPDV